MKKEYSTNLNLEKSIKNFIIEMFCICCTILDNKNILSKIIYFESLTEIENDELENKTNIFNYIMEIKNEQKFDLKQLFLRLLPYDNDGNNLKFKDFKKILISEYKIDLKNNPKNLYDWKYFSQIIMFLNVDISDNILEYTQIYLDFQNALDLSSDKIIQFNKRIFNKTELINRYLKNYVEYDLINNKDISLLRNIYTKLS